MILSFINYELKVSLQKRDLIKILNEQNQVYFGGRIRGALGYNIEEFRAVVEASGNYSGQKGSQMAKLPDIVMGGPTLEQGDLGKEAYIGQRKHF